MNDETDAPLSSPPPLQSLLDNPNYGALDADKKVEAIRNWEQDVVKTRNASGDWTLESRAEFEVQTKQAKQLALGVTPQTPEEILKGLAEGEDAESMKNLWDSLDEVNAAERDKREIDRRRFFPWMREETDATRINELTGEIERVTSDAGEAEIAAARLGAEALSGKRDVAVVRGKLIVNPDLYFDRENFVKAVNSSSATEKEKMKTLSSYYRGREDVADAMLARRPGSPGLESAGAFREFATQFAADNPDATKGDVVEAFRKSGAGEGDKWFNAVASGFLGAMEGVGYLGFGLAKLSEKQGQLAENLGLTSIGQNIQESARQTQDQILNNPVVSLRETNEAKTQMQEQADVLGGYSTAQKYGQVGGQLGGQIILTMLTGPAASITRATVGQTVKGAVATEVAEEITKGGVKKWTKEYVKNIVGPVGTMAGASSAGPVLFDAYEKARQGYAAEGFVGEELEAKARADAMTRAVRSHVVTAAVTSLFGTGNFGGAETMARLTQVAANPAARAALKKTAADYAGDVAKGAVGEGFEEALDEGINGGLDALLENPDMTFEQWFEATAFAGSAGALFGGSIQAVTTAAEAAVEGVRASPEMQQRRQVAENLRAAGVAPQTAEALEAANAQAEQDAIDLVITEVEAQMETDVTRLSELDAELAAIPEGDARREPLVAEREEIDARMGVQADALRNYDPVATANVAVADLVDTGMDVAEARQRVTSVVNKKYSRVPVTPETLVTEAGAVELPTNTSPNENETVQQAEAEAIQQTTPGQTDEAREEGALTGTPVSPTPMTPSFRSIAGRPVTVDGESGDLRIDEEDGTVLLDRPDQPPIIVSRNADAPINESEFSVRIDEGAEQDAEQARVLRTTIGGRPTARPIERPAPRTTFVRNDGAIITGSTVTDFVGEGETETGDLFVTVRDREGNEFELHGDDALTVAIARRDTARDADLDTAVSAAVSNGPALDFDRVLTRLIGPKAALLEVTTRNSKTAKKITPETTAKAVDELTELETQIQNENFPADIKARLLDIVNDAFDDVAQFAQSQPRVAAGNAPEAVAPPAGGSEVAIEPASPVGEVTTSAPARGEMTGKIPRSSQAIASSLSRMGVSVHFTTSSELAALTASHGAEVDIKTGAAFGSTRGGLFSTRSGSPRIYVLTDNSNNAKKTLLHEARHAANAIGKQTNPEAHAAAVEALQNSPELLKAAAKKYPGFAKLNPERQLSEVLSMMADGKLDSRNVPSPILRFIESVVAALRGSVLTSEVSEINGYFADLSAILAASPVAETAPAVEATPAPVIDTETARVALEATAGNPEARAEIESVLTPEQKTALLGVDENVIDSTVNSSEDGSMTQPEVLTPVEKNAIKITKLKGVEARGDGIFFVPDKVMTPARRRSLLPDNATFGQSPRGTTKIEIKPFSEVSGITTDRGWAILDRRARIAERSQPAPDAPATPVSGETEVPPQFREPMRGSAVFYSDSRDPENSPVYTDISSFTPEQQAEAIETSDGPKVFYREDGQVKVLGISPTGSSEAMVSGNSFLPSQFVSVPRNEIAKVASKNGGRLFESDDAPTIFPSLTQVEAQTLIEQYPPDAPATPDPFPVDPIPTIDENGRYQDLRIAPRQIRSADGTSSERWVVQTPENRQKELNGERQIGGDRIVSSQEEAIAAADEMIAEERRNETFAAEQARIQSEEAAATQNREAPIDAYLDARGVTKAVRNRAKSVLLQPRRLRVTSNGKIYEGTRFSVLSSLIADGYRVSSVDRKRRTEYRVEDSDGSFWEINKTEFEAGQFLQQSPDPFPVDPIPLDASPIGPRVDRGAAPFALAASPTEMTPEGARHSELEAKFNAGTITPEETAEARRLVDERAKAAGYSLAGTDTSNWSPEELGRVERIALQNAERAEVALETLPEGALKRVAEKSLKRARETASKTRRQLDSGPALKKVFHGTLSEFTVFRSLENGRSLWTADNPEVAKSYGGRVLPLLLSAKNPLVFDAEGAAFDALVFEGNRLDADDLSDIAKSRGHDALIIQNFYDSNDSGGGDVIADHYTVFDPNQIKSAEPFTGTPLDQRFNPESDSILEAASPELSDAGIDPQWSAQVNGLIDRAMAKYPNLGAKINNTINAPARTVGLTIEINPSEMAVYTDGMSEMDAAAMIDKLFLHEATHRHAVAEIGDEVVRAYANSMSADERLDIAAKYLHRSAYPTDAAWQRAVDDFAGNNPSITEGERRVRRYRLGHEALRMNVERFTTGFTTEEDLAFLQTNPTNFARFVRYLKSYLNRLKEWYAARKDPVLGVEVARLARILDTVQNGPRVDRGATPFALAASPTEMTPMDQEYLAAVEAGDTMKVERMVESRADASPFRHDLWHGTNETKYVEGKSTYGSKEAGEKLAAMAKRFGIKSPADVAVLLERWVEYGQAAEMGATVQDAIEARALRTASQGTSERGKEVLAFSVFELPSGQLELGVHLGTQQQAATFGEVFRFRVAIENPLRLPDLGSWDYQNVMREARKRGVAISEQEYDVVFNSFDNNQALRDLLIQKGFDGVVYRNEAEGDGDSFIVFKPSQIKSADPVTYDESGNVIPLSQRFNPESDSILEAAPARRGLWNRPKKGEYVPGGAGTAANWWDQRLYEFLEKARGAYKSEMKTAEWFAKDVSRAVKKIFKDDVPGGMKAVNDALGNVENRMTLADVAAIKDIKKRGLASAQSVYMKARAQANALEAAGDREGAALIRQDSRIVFNNAVTAYKDAAKNYETQARVRARAQADVDRRAALAQLPQDLQDKVENLRSRIDQLSNRMIAEGNLTDELKATIDENRGLWLHRSYEIFDDPNYSTWIREQRDPEAVRRRNKAVSFIRGDLIARDKAKRIAKGTPAAQAQIEAEAATTDALVNDVFEDYLMVADGGSKHLITGSTVSKETAALMQRGTIPQELQELWGRYDDPAVNAAKSISSISQFLSINEFFQETLNLGVSEGWLIKPQDGVPKVDAQGNRLVELFPNGGKTGMFGNTASNQYAPLAGYWGPPALAEALKQSVDDRGSHKFMQFFTAMTGYAMAMKTAGSVQSRSRNFLGNALPALVNGNIVVNPKTWNKAARLARVHMTGNKFMIGGVEATAAERAEAARLVELGVFGDTVTVNLINELTGGFAGNRKAIGLKGKSKTLQAVDRFVVNPTKALYDYAGSEYAIPDEIWKYINYQAEVDRVTKYRPGAAKAAIEEEAAEIVKRTTFTYSRAPEFVKWLRRQPVIAPFITFPSEVVRVTYNQFTLAGDQIVEGLKTGNKKLAQDGYGRAAKIAIVGALVYATPAIVRSLLGFTEKDEDDLREHVAPWAKNSTLLLLPTEDRTKGISYADISYLNPYDVIFRPFRSIMRNMRDGDMDGFEIAWEATKEATDPVLSEQILLGAVLDARSGIAPTGKRIWETNDSDVDKLAKSAAYVTKTAMSPGTLDTGRRIKDAALGKVSTTGKASSLSDELIAILGPRASSIDTHTTMRMAGGKFRGETLNSRAVFTRTIKSRGTQSDQEIIDAYVRSNELLASTFRELREKYVGAIELRTMTREEAVRLMKDSGVSKSDIGDILNNRYRRLELRRQDLLDARREGTKLGQDREALYRQALELVPPVQQISEDDRQ